MRLQKVLVSPDATIKAAIQQLNENAMQILLVVNADRRLLGTVTDGDIRRGILDNVPFSEPVNRIMFTKPRWLLETEREQAVALMKAHRITSVPVLTAEHTVVDLILWGDLGENQSHAEFPPQTSRVFILAGGKGVRLQPFTNILPKPLIPLGDKPILELIMKQLQGFGFNRFMLSLNYKAEMIKLYFAENAEGFEIEYLQEKDFLGTAGSLSLVKDRVHESLLVCNCDTLLDVNFHDFLQQHKAGGNDATVVGVIRNYRVPYGVISVKNGELDSFIEKPEYDYIVNAGIYILEPSMLQLLGENEAIDMPSLMLKGKSLGRKIGVYPVSGDWIDVGRWEEYQDAAQKLERFRFLPFRQAE